jgi:pimeloyl-ACP methyl ester carboxylesterase
MAPTTHLLQRPEGRIGYDVEGAGPLLVLVPGMGDLRSSYRHLAPLLVAAGYRVASVDLRGHGDSDATFSAYGDEPTADDLAALIDELGGPAVLVGNSMGAGSAVLAAAAHPDRVAALVLIGPFVRDPRGGAVKRLLLRAAMVARWAPSSWNSYLPKLYAGAKPADYDAYRRQVVASLERPGYARAFSLTTRTRHGAAERALGSLAVPALVVMGDRDPDFPDPAAEATWIATQLHGRVVLVADAAHYPQSQQPGPVATAITGFLAEVRPRA